MAVVKAEYLVAKDSESGEEQNVKFVPPAPSDGDLGGISKEDSEQITENKNDITDIRKTLWDKILDKLTNAVVTRLNTTDKTVIGALNELNSKGFLGLIDASLTDWNNINASGWYSGNSEMAKNAPSRNGWVNAIALASNGNTEYMVVFAFAETGLYIRQSSNGIWGDWHDR